MGRLNKFVGLFTRFAKGAMPEGGALRRVGGALKRAAVKRPGRTGLLGLTGIGLGAWGLADGDDDDDDDGSAMYWIGLFVVGVILSLLSVYGFYLLFRAKQRKAAELKAELMGGGKKINNAMKTINKYSPFIIIFLAYLIYYSYEKYMVLLEEQEKLKEYKKQYFT